MSIHNAQLFLSRIQKDTNFRNKIESANSESELHKILQNYNISFSSTEIEDAFNMLHVSCQTEDDAESLKHAYLYYQLLIS